MDNLIQVMLHAIQQSRIGMPDTKYRRHVVDLVAEYMLTDKFKEDFKVFCDSETAVYGAPGRNAGTGKTIINKISNKWENQKP